MFATKHLKMLRTVLITKNSGDQNISSAEVEITMLQGDSHDGVK